jgi:hypothetical protein
MTAFDCTLITNTSYIFVYEVLEEFYSLERNAIWSGRSSLKFRRNLPQSSSKSKVKKKGVRRGLVACFLSLYPELRNNTSLLPDYTALQGRAANLDLLFLFPPSFARDLRRIQ